MQQYGSTPYCILLCNILQYIAVLQYCYVAVSLLLYIFLHTVSVESH